MKVLVLGAGVVGATTACLLARDGHAVTVVDRQSAPGLETSFANGGQLAASHGEPWASPETLVKLLTWLGRSDVPLKLPLYRLAFDRPLWGWGLRFMLASRPGAWRSTLEHITRLALHSRDCLAWLRETVAPAYDARANGLLHIYRDRHAVAHAARVTDLMAAAGLERRAVSVAEAVALEPALTDAAPALAGAVFCPGDESGDAHLFTRAMIADAERHGAQVRYGITVHGLYRTLGGRHSRVLGATTSVGPITADAVVLALGSVSPMVTRTIGLSLPIYPTKGYSITLDTAGAAPDAVPGRPIIDNAHRMVYARLGERLRCAGTAAFEGWSETLDQRRVALATRHARALFPRAGSFHEVAPWCGLRPSTPHGLPYLGLAPGLENLFLNTGHGTLGWTLATGSARVTADLISGRRPALDLRPYRRGGLSGL